MQSLAALTLAFRYYISTSSLVIASEIEDIKRNLRSSLLDPALFTLSLGLFFRWAKGGIEGVSSDMPLVFIPQEAYRLSWQMVGTTVASVASSLLTGIASDLFYPRVQESRVFTVW